MLQQRHIQNSAQKKKNNFVFCVRFCIFANSSTGHDVWIAGNEYQEFGKRYDMKQEINPKDSPRGYAFELWKTAGMPKVTIFKTFDITRLIKVAKRSGMKTNMLMCWCIGKAASPIEEFYTLPAGGHLWQYDRLAVNTVVMTVNGTVRLCDIPYSEDIHQFNEDYLRLTRQVHDTNEDHLLGDEYMAVDTSTLVECEIDGVASVYS